MLFSHQCVEAVDQAQSNKIATILNQKRWNEDKDKELYCVCVAIYWSEVFWFVPTVEVGCLYIMVLISDPSDMLG